MLWNGHGINEQIVKSLKDLYKKLTVMHAAGFRNVFGVPLLESAQVPAGSFSEWLHLHKLICVMV